LFQEIAMLKALLRYRHNRALFEAIEGGSIEGIKHALAEGANANASRQTYEIIPHAYENPVATGTESALYVAMRQPNMSEAIVDLLRDAGAEMDTEETAKIIRELNQKQPSQSTTSPSRRRPGM
jgi:hypothetical protein